MTNTSFGGEEYRDKILKNLENYPTLTQMFKGVIQSTCNNNTDFLRINLLRKLALNFHGVTGLENLFTEVGSLEGFDSLTKDLRNNLGNAQVYSGGILFSCPNVPAH